MRGRALLAAVPVLVAIACSKYGDEDETPLPDRGGTTSSSGSGGAEGGVIGVDTSSTSTSSSGSTSGVPVGTDGGPLVLPDGGPATTTNFCKTMKDALRCLDFDGRPARPFGFDSFLGAVDAAKLTDAVNGNSALRISSTLPAGGVFSSLPQGTKPLSIAFDTRIESITGTPTLVGVIGAGPSCPANAGSVGLLASAGANGARLSITNLTPELGDVPLNTLLHVTLRSDPAPAPGKTINGTVVVEVGDKKLTQSWKATLPLGCTSFTGAIGGSGALTSSAVTTIDNVVMLAQ